MSPKTKEDVLSDVNTLTLPDPLEIMGAEYKKIAILGVGLIGGSIGLRLRAMDFPGLIIGYDLANVLDQALARGAIDRGAGDISEAIMDADLIVMALSVGEIAKMLPTVLKTAKPGAVVTDTGAVKKELFDIAAATKEKRATYIGGHPLAGSNRQGIANANSELFTSAYWLMVIPSDASAADVDSLKWWIRMLGAYPITIDPEVHDRIFAMTTHMPFMLMLALSHWIAEESIDLPLLQKLSTGNFQTITGMAVLPLSVWESVLKSNRENVLNSLDKFRVALDVCERELRKDNLQELWQRSNSFQRKLARERPGDWDSQSELAVTVPDRPGTIARIAGILAEQNINIRDIGLLNVRERQGGVLRVTLESRADTRRAIQILKSNGYDAIQRD